MPFCICIWILKFSFWPILRQNVLAKNKKNWLLFCLKMGGNENFIMPMAFCDKTFFNKILKFIIANLTLKSKCLQNLRFCDFLQGPHA